MIEEDAHQVGAKDVGIRTMGVRHRPAVLAAKLDGLVERTVNRGNVFEELSAKLSELIASSPARDLEKNARALLSSFLSRLDLVTREEFDVQAEVLRRTREKLDQLEAKVVELENQRKSGAT